MADAVAACVRSCEEAAAMRQKREEAAALEQMRQAHEARMATEPVTEEQREQQRLEALRKQNMELVGRISQRVLADARKEALHSNDLTDEVVFNYHANLLIMIANKVLAHQNRKFVVDDNNLLLLRFLLYYFNGCPKAEEVFPERGYKLHKHLMLRGAVGTGKTLLMEIFAEYLRYTDNPRQFHNLSVSQMANYYKLHNCLDRYTFNEESSKGFQCTPVHICLNDVGVASTSFYGISTKEMTEEFLHARNEIWVHYHKFAHVTTNLTTKQLAQEYNDGFGRLVDRFKTYNVVPVEGSSRR